MDKIVVNLKRRRRSRRECATNLREGRQHDAGERATKRGGGVSGGEVFERGEDGRI